MKTSRAIISSIRRNTLHVVAFFGATITVFSSHPVLAAALELFPAEFDQKIALVATDPRVIAARVINAALAIVGVVMVGLVIYGGFTYMTANGDDEKVKSAKKILTRSAIGLAIILSSLAITRFVLKGFLDDVSTGDSCTNVGVTATCTVDSCNGTRTCSPGGFYSSCIKLDSQCSAGSGGSIPSGVFGIRSINPSGEISSKKIVVKVVLTEPPNIDTIAGAIVVKKKSDSSLIPGKTYAGSITFARGTAFEKVLPLAADTLAFVPDAPCVGYEARDLHCFEGGTDYIVEVSGNVARADGAVTLSSFCGNLSSERCRGAFKSGTEVDITPPTASVRVDPTAISTSSCATVQAMVSDAGGVGPVEFWHAATIVINGRTVTTTDKFGESSGASASATTAQGQWCPSPTTSINERHYVFVRAFDNDTGVVETARQEIILRPAGSCTVCGNGCGNCESSSCTTNADCFNGLTCDATTRTCQAKPRISAVMPGNGRSGTMVTVWGINFGATPGRIEFAGPNGTRIAAELPNRCGASFQSWTMDATTKISTVTILVPQGAVDGPVSVLTAAGATDFSNDGAGVLTPSNLPGTGVPPIGEFDVNESTHPGLCGVLPQLGQWDTRVQLAGQEMGSSTGAVMFNGTPASRVESYTNTSATASVPRMDYGANQPVTVIAPSGNESNGVPFKVESPEGNTVPEILSINPNASGGPSTGIVITGKNFGAAPGIVYFAAPDGQVVAADLNGLPDECGANYWNPNEIRVKVPRILDRDDWNANNNQSEVLVSNQYHVHVVRYDEIESNRVNFNMTGVGQARPFIWCIAPRAGKQFTNITVYGEQLGAAPTGAGKGLFFKPRSGTAATPATLTSVGAIAGQPCPQNGWDDSRICAQVPGNAVSGPVKIDTTCGDLSCSSNEVLFSIGSCNSTDPASLISCRAQTEECCSNGICQATGSCSATVADGYYGWTFTTSSIPVSPRVIEDCAENALTLGSDTVSLGGRFASPSPWASRAGGDSVCQNAAVTVRFSLPVIEESLNTDRVVLEQCGAGTAQPIVSMGFESLNDVMPQIINPARLGASIFPMPGSAAEGSSVLVINKSEGYPNRNAARCSNDVTKSCASAASCGGGSGTVCEANKGDANVYTDDFAVSIPLPTTNEVRGRTFVASVAVRRATGTAADPTRVAGILIRKKNQDNTIEEARVTSEALTEDWQNLSVRLTVGEKPGTVEARLYLVSPSASNRDTGSEFYTYAAFFDQFTLADIAGVDCTTIIPTTLEALPSGNGICTGDYETACSTDDQCESEGGGVCVNASSGLKLTPAAGDTFAPAWYRVTLKAGSCSNDATKSCVTKSDCGNDGAFECDGITAFDPQGAAMKENPGKCGNGNAYCFLFRVVNKTCTVGAIITTPNPWTARKQYEEVSYAALPIAAEDACVNLNPAGYNWEWSSSRPDKATVEWDGLLKVGRACVSSSQCAIGECVNRVCAQMKWTTTAVARDETPVVPVPAPVVIRASIESTVERSRVSGGADLFVQFVDPVVTESWPRCAAACLNAEMGARFNVPMNPATLTATDNIQLWQVNCGNGRIDPRESCDDGNSISGDGCSDICKRESSSFRFRCGNAQIDIGEDCDDSNAVSGDGCSQNCRTESVLNGAWLFESKNGATHLVGQTAVTPDWTLVKSGVCGNGIVERVLGTGVIGEACDDGNVVSGDGCSDKCALEGTTPIGAICGNGTIERGEECERGADGVFPTWCRSAPTGSNTAGACLRQGTSAPVCGNRKIDLGEECEPLLLAENARGLCAATTCLWQGTLDYNPPVRLVGCGNAKIELGEECDDGNTRDNDSCSAICLNEGSRAIVGPGCGNGRIDTGESCDINHTATKAGCDPNTCLRRGTNYAVCGNGVVDTGEDCDWQLLVDSRPPGSVIAAATTAAQAVCSSVCLWNGTAGSLDGSGMPLCGNSRIDLGESCDDGNRISGDGCSDKCLNEGAAATRVSVGTTLNDLVSPTEVILTPRVGADTALLLSNSTYRVIVMRSIASTSGKALTGLNFWRPDGSRITVAPGEGAPLQSPNSYTWTFTTGTQICTPERVQVAPVHSSLYVIGAQARLTATPVSKPDSCSAMGQRLNAFAYGWDWSSGTPLVAEVLSPQDRMPQCGNAVLERGEDCDDGNIRSGDSCSENCLNEGALYERQCGNKNIDAGESCDDGNTISGDGCSSRCLNEGFLPGIWNLGENVTGDCGNGIVERSANATSGIPGEECDDNNLKSGDGCSPLCLKEGTRAPLCNDDGNSRLDEHALTRAGEACDPKDPATSLGCNAARCIWAGTTAARCRNGILEPGEECDDKNTTPGDGCSNVCLREGAPAADWLIEVSASGETRLLASGAPRSGSRVLVQGVCGNGTLERVALDGNAGYLGEECDDRNNRDNDGCSSRCLNEGVINTAATNPGGDPSQQVVARGITVKKYCRRVDRDFSRTQTDCRIDSDCSALGPATEPPYICDVFEPWETATITSRICADDRCVPARQQGAKGKTGTAEVTVFCGSKSDDECAASSGFGTDIVGVGQDSCCYERPTPDAPLVEPTLTTGVCPNGVLAVGFNQLVDERSLSGNVLLARLVNEDACPAGSVAVDALGHVLSSVTNSSFEIGDNGLDSWKVSRVDAAAQNGTRREDKFFNTGRYSLGQDLVLEGSGNKPGSVVVSTEITAKLGVPYRAAVWYKVREWKTSNPTERRDAAFLRVRSDDGFSAQYSVPVTASALVDADWQNLYVSFTPKTRGQYFIELVIAKPSIAIMWDDVTLDEVGSARVENASWIAQFIDWVRGVFTREEVSAQTGVWCLAGKPNAVVEPRDNGVSSIVRVWPHAVLEKNANYALIMRGDDNVNDAVSAGITNYRGVAMNGETVNRWTFTTAAQLCLLDEVRMDLSCTRGANTTCTAFQQSGQVTAVAARARSHNAGGQEIRPVDGYRWAWSFNQTAPTVADVTQYNVKEGLDVIQRRGGAFDGSRCPPGGDDSARAITCIEGQCGNSTHLPECANNASCSSLTDVADLGKCLPVVNAHQDVTAHNARGQSVVTAGARITEDFMNQGDLTELGKTVQASVRFENTLCEKPWPPVGERRCSKNPNLVCTSDTACGTGRCVAALPLADAESSLTTDPLGGRRPTNFSFWYCRDAKPDLLPEPMSVGLPELTVVAQANRSSRAIGSLLPQMSGDASLAVDAPRSEILKEVILGFTGAQNSNNDAIGIRVVKNERRSSVLDWYRSQGFTGSPSPLPGQIDGYDAIQDGRTVYIGGTNKDILTSGPVIYSNIYIIAYNEGATEPTKVVFREILKNFRLNVNIISSRVCAGSVATSCTRDADCRADQGPCVSDLDKLRRDITRMNDLSRMALALEATHARTGRYPLLDAGTFVRSISTSRWPSWGSLAGSIGIAAVDDPLKSGFKNCPTAQGYDTNTCFNQQKGEYQCPGGSQVYQYQSIGGQSFKLSADFEYIPAPLTRPSAALWGLDDNVFNIAHCRVDGQAVRAYSNRLICGDGAIGRDDGEGSPNCSTDADCRVAGSKCIGGKCAEECEIGQVDRRSCSLGGDTIKRCRDNGAVDCSAGVNACTPSVGVNYGPCVTIAPEGGQILGERTRTCTRSCSYEEWSACRVNNFCGDNKVDPGEVCDDGALNGTYGKCNALCTGSGSYCGDTRVDQGEVCDDGEENGSYGKCKDDCSGKFAFCGDRDVQEEYGETCDPIGEIIRSPGYCNIISTPTKVHQPCSRDADCGGADGSCELCGPVNGYQAVREVKCGVDLGNVCRVIQPWGGCQTQDSCGNGRKDGTEQCDDGNSVNTDACVRDAVAGIMCRNSVCGDGFVRANTCAGDTSGRICTTDSECGDNGRCITNEECDQGTNNGISCTPRSGSSCTYCSAQCRRVTVSGDYCGDGRWNSAVEECDKNLSPAVNNWEGLNNHLCVGMPGVTQRAWDFTTMDGWQTSSNSITMKQMLDSSGQNAVLGIAPKGIMGLGSLRIQDATVYGVKFNDAVDSTNNTGYRVIAYARCANEQVADCGRIGGEIVRQGQALPKWNCDQIDGRPGGNIYYSNRAECIRVKGSDWTKLEFVERFQSGIGKGMLRLFMDQHGTSHGVMLNNVTIEPISYWPDLNPWHSISVGVKEQNVSQCNEQSCQRGCPLGGNVCENILLPRTSVCIRHETRNGQEVCVESRTTAPNDQDDDKIVDQCDADKDGDGDLDLTDCNPDNRELHSDAGKLFSFDNITWSFKPGSASSDPVRAMTFLIFNRNISTDPSPLGPEQDLSRMRDDAWRASENTRLTNILRSKWVCLRSDGSYTSKICTTEAQCGGNACKPWPTDPSAKVEMLPHDGFFSIRVSLNGTPLDGFNPKNVPAKGMNDAQELKVTFADPLEDNDVVTLEWLNDWCDRGTPGGDHCTSSDDGIGHDLNLVISKITLDTTQKAGVCEIIADQNNQQVWPSR